MHWVWPQQVLSITVVLVPALGGLAWWAARRRQRLLAPWAGQPPQPGSLGTRFGRRSGRALALAGAWVLALIALARPQSGTLASESGIGGTVVLAIDVSASMRAADVMPSRLAQAAEWLQGLAAQFPGCRLGLIVFAGEAQVLCPPTLDHTIVRDLLAELTLGLPVREGSELGPALDLGQRVLERAGGGVLVVATDGEHHDREPRAVLRGGPRSVLDLLTLTVGGSAPIAVPGARAGGVITDPRHGGVALTAAHPEAMRALARAVGGLALDGAPSAAVPTAAVRFIEARLARRATPTVEARRAERFQWPVGLALLLLALRLALPETRGAAPRWRRAAALGAALVLLLTPGALVGDEDDDAEPARLAALRAASLHAPGHDRPRCLYNLALALHQSGQEDEARRTYTCALALPGAAGSVRARCLNNLAVLATETARARAPTAAAAAIEALGQAQAALHEALRLDPRLEVAQRNLEEARALADRLQARLAATGSGTGGRSARAAPTPALPAGAGQALGAPPAALPATGSPQAQRAVPSERTPAPDRGALECLCQEAGSALEFTQILLRSNAPESRPAPLPW